MSTMSTPQPPANAPPNQLRRKSASDFQFGTRIGEGSYSTVFSAMDLHNKKTFAIKVLSKKHIVREDKVKYVNIEKTTLHRLGQQHPGIVQLYCTFQDESSLFFVLDFAEYGELLSVITKFGSLSETVSKFYMIQIIDSVRFIHLKGVIHRDLKPENILVGYDFNLKITDFGAAKLLGEDDLSQSDVIDYQTVHETPKKDRRRASFVGTAEYVPPELLQYNECGFETDIWALGCILYQLFNGVPPFKAATEYATFERILSAQYTYRNPLPPYVRELIERTLVQDPKKRPSIPQLQALSWFSGVPWNDRSYIWGRKVPRFEPFIPNAAPSQQQQQQAAPVLKTGSNRNMNKSTSTYQLHSQIQHFDYNFVPTIGGTGKHQPPTRIKKGLDNGVVAPMTNQVPLQSVPFEPSSQILQSDPSFLAQAPQNHKRNPSRQKILMEQQRPLHQRIRSTNQAPPAHMVNPMQMQNPSLQFPPNIAPPSLPASRFSDPSIPQASPNAPNSLKYAGNPPPRQPMNYGAPPMERRSTDPQNLNQPPPSTLRYKDLRDNTAFASQNKSPTAQNGNFSPRLPSSQPSSQGKTQAPPQQAPYSPPPSAKSAANVTALRAVSKTLNKTDKSSSSSLTKSEQFPPPQRNVISFKDISSFLESGEKIIKLDTILKSLLSNKLIGRKPGEIDDSNIEKLIERHQDILDSKMVPVVACVTNRAKVFLIDDDLSVMMVDLTANQGGDYLMYDYEFESVMIDDDEEDKGEEVFGYLILELIKEGGDLVFLKRIKEEERRKYRNSIKVVNKNNDPINIGTNIGWIDCLVWAKDLMEKEMKSKKNSKVKNGASKRTTSAPSKPATAARKPSPTSQASKTNKKPSSKLAYAAAAAAHR